MHYFVTYWCNLIVKSYVKPSLSDMGTYPSYIIVSKPAKNGSQLVFIQCETRNILMDISEDKT
jgi:hypothetical protein